MFDRAPEDRARSLDSSTYLPQSSRWWRPQAVSNVAMKSMDGAPAPGHLRVLVHAGQSAAEDAKQTHFVLLDVCACLGKIPVDWA